MDTLKKKKQKLILRPPIVAVLGHVDHGKTTLLDYIRKSRLAAKEFGGITQKIGAYQTEVQGRKITFIDTPGHQAFEKLRARGAKTADIALLVVDACDSVKPQTVEAIKHIKKAAIPIIVAINKTDLPSANPERVKKDLIKEEIVVEKYGGKVAAVEISAKTGTGVSDLLEAILLVFEFKEIKADPNGPFTGVIIESSKDKRRGNIATIIVKSGTLRVPNEFYVFGSDKDTVSLEKVKVRALFDEYGKTVKEAEPGKPVEVLGFNNIPLVGSLVSEDEKLSQGETVSQTKKEENKAEGKMLKVIIKAESAGSLEAVLDGLPKEVQVIYKGIGEITENDVTFAKTTKAFILGFNLKPQSQLIKFAEDEGVKMRTYNIIYRLFEEINDVISYLSKGPQIKILGKAKILQEFATSEGKVAGCQITEGRIVRGDKIQLIRREKVVMEGRIREIRERKEKVNKVEKGKLCGITIAPQFDFFIGDMIQSYSIV